MAPITRSQKLSVSGVANVLKAASVGNLKKDTQTKARVKNSPKSTPAGSGPSTSSAIDIEDILSDGRKRFDRDFPLILEMRKNGDAPVDTIGCHMLADPEADIHTRHFQTLVALLLSPRVKDSQTAIAMKNLKEFGLTVDKITQTSVDAIRGQISFIGLSQTKAERVKNCAQILKDSYNSQVPNDYETLLALPGVGPKIAGLVMVNCFNSDQFIGVDTHVHRIANLLKWIKTKSPEESDQALKKLIPRNLWRQLNVALVGMGQTICPANHPHCNQCLLRSTCPFPKKPKALSSSTKM